MTPKTALGKLVGSFLLFISMVYLALPMTIIVSKFNKAFERFKEEEEEELLDAAEDAAEALEAESKLNGGPADEKGLIKEVVVD